jgi:hypothetical protein
VHVPPVRVTVTVAPDTEQTDGVVVLNVTGKLELAVAEIAIGAELILAFDSAAKLMVCENGCAGGVTANDCATSGAAEYAGIVPDLPPWSAKIVHVPVSTSVTVVPDTVHTDGVGVLNVTVKPEATVADTANGAVPKTWFGNAAKLIVCACAAYACGETNKRIEVSAIQVAVKNRFITTSSYWWSCLYGAMSMQNIKVRLGASVYCRERVNPAIAREIRAATSTTFLGVTARTNIPGFKIFLTANDRAAHLRRQWAKSSPRAQSVYFLIIK